MMNAAGDGGAALAIAASALALAVVAHARAPLLLRPCGRGGHDGEMAWLAQHPALLFGGRAAERERVCGREVAFFF
jgi:hypothetical protein